MNRLLTAILVFILTDALLITGCSSPSTMGDSAQAPQVGKLAPDFQLPSLEGQSISLSDSRGSPVLVNFWASWCGPCRSEMPYIQEIYEGWTGRGLVILAINLGESHTKVESFMQSYALSFPVLLDTNQDVANNYNIIGIPTTFFIDGYGIIQAIKIGAFSGTAEIEENLSKILP